MNVDGFIDALDQIGKALDGGNQLGPMDLPVHLLPMHGDGPVAGPCILVGWPRLTAPIMSAGAACGHVWTAQIDLTVVAESTRGHLLPIYLDAVMAQLAQHRLKVTDTTSDTYQATGTPAGLPAVTLTVE